MIKAHTPYLGNTGYNAHAQGFFRALSQHIPLTIRNFSFSDNLDLDNLDKRLISEQTYFHNNNRIDKPTNNFLKQFPADKIHIVLSEVNHYYFYDHYEGQKIAYTVWESTKFPDDFFKKLLEYDQLWVVSEWAKECAIKQGFPEHKIFIVREAINQDILNIQPINPPTTNEFRCLVVGRWEYRKSTTEIVQAFCKVFKNNQHVKLILLTDNPFAQDGLKLTEERLSKLNINDPRIEIKRFLSRQDYLQLIQNSHLFVSCARSEGWGIPQMEAMALGVPTIFSDYGAQLEFSANFPLKVPVAIKPANLSPETKDTPGEWCEPDFQALEQLLLDCYNNYEFVKNDALSRVSEFRKTFTWETSVEQAITALKQLPQQDEVLFITGGNKKYFPITSKLLKSLELYSKNRLVIYGVNDRFETESQQAICKQINLPINQPSDVFYFKQKICLQALKDFPLTNKFIWIDNDSIANYNIDDLNQYFTDDITYPVADRHILEEYYTHLKNSKGEITWETKYNDQLCEELNIPKKKGPLAHACLFLFNQRCAPFFQEILDTYELLKEKKKDNILWWNDEGIDNLLRWKYGYDKFLPLSNFETGFNPERVFEFFSKPGPYNFNDPCGWNLIPADKNSVLYFHGNKDPKQADVILELIKSGHADTFSFYLNENTKVNFSTLPTQVSVLEMAKKHGWFAAIFHEIFNVRDYTFIPEIKISPGDTVVDIGANFGVFSRFARWQGAIKVYSFEPDPFFFSLLKLNAHPEDVLFRCAVSNTNAKKDFYLSNHIGGSTMFPKSGDHRKVSVNCFTLDYLFRGNLFSKIDFLKIDTEGAELDILEGVSDQNLLKIKTVALEYHNFIFNKDPQKRETLIKRFHSLGFRSYTLHLGQTDDLLILYFWK